MELSKIPANRLWKRGIAPVERLESLNTAMKELEGDTLKICRQESADSKETEKFLSRLSSMEDALQETQPLFPYETNPVMRRYMTRDPYRNNVTWRTHHAIERFAELEERVSRSLKTPGPSTEEMEGIIFKKSVDEKIRVDFKSIGDDIGYLVAQANRTRAAGM